MSSIYKYHSFGLNIESSIELPELLKARFNKGDVKIKFGNNPKQVPNIKTSGALFQASENSFLLKLNSIGSFHVQNGSDISIEKAANANEDDLRLILLGSVFGALLHQRGLLPIHGSCVHKNGITTVFSGISGAGKSSLAAMLVNRGYTLIADDISVLELSNDTTMVTPGIPHMKLWHDVMIELNKNPSDHKKVRSQLLKYRVPNENHVIEESLHLNQIIILRSRNISTFSIKEIHGVEKFELLKNNTFRYRYIAGLEQFKLHFSYISRIASSTRIFILNRPSSPLDLESLADVIESEFYSFHKQDK